MSQPLPTGTPLATGNDVLTAEIWWALKLMSAHYSCHSSEDSSFLFQHIMFPDSDIASRFACSETKSSYLTTFGIAPYFADILRSKVKSDLDYVLLFDESMNKKNGKKQMDWHIRFWDNNMVKTRYYTSQFVGHCKATDMVNCFHDVIAGLKRSNLIQLSMDGPSVNWKFFNMIQEETKEEFKHSLLNVGSCGLHTVHGAFKTGAEKSKIDTEKILSGLFYLFHETPARREDFANITKTELLPLKFCKTRWVESAAAAARAYKIWPSVCAYVTAVHKKEVPNPGTNSFTVVEEATRDSLALVKLAFFESVANEVQPLLTKYQTDMPMLPFLVDDLRGIVKGLLQRYVKDSFLKDINTVTLLGLSDIEKQEPHYKEIHQLDLGIKAEKALREVKHAKKCSDKDVLDTRQKCRNFLAQMVSKLLQKTPLIYKLARMMGCLDPRKVCRSQSQSNFKELVLLLTQENRMSETQADVAHRQFCKLDDDVKKECKNFDPDDPDDRLDSFWFRILSSKKNLHDVWHVIRMLLVLSHGQATVERGFSVNREVETENLSDKALVARRIICDHITAVGGLRKMKVTKELLLAASSARYKYHSYLEQERQERKEKEQKNLKRKLHEELDDIKKRKKQTVTDIKELTKDADKLAMKAENKGNLTLLAKSNSMRAKATEKEAQLKLLEKKLEDKLNEIKND